MALENIDGTMDVHIGEIQSSVRLTERVTRHETYQIVGNQTLDFDDRAVVRQAIEGRR